MAFRENIQWRNYIGFVDIEVERYWEPESLRELRELVEAADREDKHVHAVGAGWSFEDVAATRDWMVDLRRLGRVIDTFVNPIHVSGALTDEWLARLPGTNDRLVHIEAGARLFDLCHELDDRNMALPTLGGALGQHLAGAISTSTHGSDIDQPPLCDLVQAVHLVTTGGREMWIESASRPLTKDDAALRDALVARPPDDRASPDLEIVRDDDLLHSVIVSMGRFGVIYSFVLEVTPAFRLAEFTQTLTWTEVSAALADGVGDDDPFANLVAQLDDPPSTLNISEPANYRYLDLAFGTRNINTCHVRRRWVTTEAGDLNMAPTSDFLCHKGAANGILLAAAEGLHIYAGIVAAIPGYGLVKSPEIVARAAGLQRLAGDPHLTGGRALAAASNAIWSSQVAGVGGELEWILDEISGSAVSGAIFPHNARTQGRRGANWEISASSEDPASVGTCYRGNSIEVIFGVDSRAYIDFITTIVNEARGYRQAGYMAVRFTRRSQALLSMHNVGHDLACSVEITSLQGLADNERWMRRVENLALARGGRPHWGQQNNLTADHVEALYGERRLEVWRRQLARTVGTSMTFSNGYTRQRGLEPARSSLAHAAWVHGHSLHVEFPDRVERQTSFGFFQRVEGRPDSHNWLHFAIPTPVIIDDERAEIGSVMLHYRSAGGAIVHAVHVYDGEERIAEHNGLDSHPAEWAFERFTVGGRPPVRWGVGISIGVRFPEAGARLEFAAAGADFLGWE